MFMDFESRVWDNTAALQSCWFECETYPTSAYKYPSNDADFLYLTGYRDEATRAEWYDNVLFFSCLAGCRSQLKAQRWMYILVPSFSAAVVFVLLVCCLVCKGCPLARWCRDSRANSAKIKPKAPFLVEESTLGLGYNTLHAAKDSDYGQYRSRTYRRRANQLDRKMNHLDSIYHSTPIPKAPPAATYNRLEPGMSLSHAGLTLGAGQGAETHDSGPLQRLATATKRKLTARSPSNSGKIKVAR